MTMRFATIDEETNWNEKILQNPDKGDVLQSVQFAMMRQLGEWKPRYIVFDTLSITILEKTVPGLGAMWYIPKGPGVKSVAELQKVLAELKKFAHKHNVFVVKLEPELLKTAETMQALRALNLTQVSPIQPNASTVLIDLLPSIDDILMGLNQKGRHAIRRAERDGVTIKRVQANDKNCKEFYALLSETAEGSFMIRSYEYFKTFWQLFEKNKMGQMFFAYYDDKLVAAAFALIFGEKSTYKDGASIRERTAYGASHLLQWEVIKWAKEHGALQHNLYGAPPSDKINDESHPIHGVGRFKTSFNKQVVDYVGVFDAVIRPRQYSIWVKFGERAAKSLWWRSHHESWY